MLNVVLKYNPSSNNFCGIVDVYFESVEHAEQFVHYHLANRTNIDGFYVLFDYKPVKKAKEQVDFDYLYSSNTNTGQFDISPVPTNTIVIRNVDILTEKQEIVQMLSEKIPFNQIWFAMDKILGQFLGFLFVQFYTVDDARTTIALIGEQFQSDFANQLDLATQPYWDETVELESWPGDVFRDFYDSISSVK